MLTQDQKDRLLDELAANAVFDDWGDRSLKDAAQAIDVDPVFAAEALPTRVERVLAHSALGDRRMAEFVRRGGLAGQDGVRGCIHTLIMQRFVAHNEVKLAVQKGVSVLSSPLYSLRASRATWSTVDQIWTLTATHLAHDGDDRFNHVTKRALLSGVYGASVLAWFNDDGANLEKTSDFLSARLDNVVDAFGLIAKGRRRFERPTAP